MSLGDKPGNGTGQDTAPSPAPAPRAESPLPESQAADLVPMGANGHQASQRQETQKVAGAGCRAGEREGGREQDQHRP